MARPQKYHRHDVLLHSLNLFWEQGYHTTSLPQLLAITGLSSSSFYSSFGDKLGLFSECFQLYSAGVDNVLNVVRKCEEPAEAIYYYFSNTLFPGSHQREQSGCFVINTLMEFEGVDNTVFAMAQKQLADTDDAFAECFTRAQEQGLLTKTLKASNIIALINTLGTGIQVRRRAGLSKTEIKEIVDTFILSIGCKPIPFSAFNKSPHLSLISNKFKAQ